MGSLKQAWYAIDPTLIKSTLQFLNSSDKAKNIHKSIMSLYFFSTALRMSKKRAMISNNFFQIR